MIRCSKLFGLAATVSLLFVGAAHAATVSFTLDNDAGSDSADVDITISDTGVDMVDITATVNDPVNGGDLRGLFFDIAGGVPSNLKINGVAFAAAAVYGGGITDADNNTTNLGGGNNVNGALPATFTGNTADLAVEIGTPGAGGDFFETITFSLMGDGLDVSDFFGQAFAARVTSVGPGCSPNNSSSCGGSSKQGGTVPDDDMTPVPLPAAGWMLLAGVGGLVAMRRRRKA